jgi:hypothetical protein
MGRTILLSADSSCIFIYLLFINASTFKRIFKINQEQASLKGTNLRMFHVSRFNLCKNIRYCF